MLRSALLENLLELTAIVHQSKCVHLHFDWWHILRLVDVWTSPGAACELHSLQRAFQSKYAPSYFDW
jgi:hypothetical protein